jgi:signal peptidase II
MTQAQRTILIVVVVVSCIGCDQAAKTIAQQTLPANESVNLPGDVFHLQYSENYGAMLGIGSDLPPELRFWLFTVFAGCALTAILAFVLTNGKLNIGGIFSLSLILGGGLSNLINRVLRGGVVVDFMVVVLGSVRTAIYNLADLAILAGLLEFLLSSIPSLSRSARVTR